VNEEDCGLSALSAFSNALDRRASRHFATIYILGISDMANFCIASSRCINSDENVQGPCNAHDVIHWRFIDDVLPYDIFIFFVSPFGVTPTSVHYRCVDIGRTVRVGFVQQRDYRQQDSPEKDRTISHSESSGYDSSFDLPLSFWHTHLTFCVGFHLSQGNSPL